MIDRDGGYYKKRNEDSFPPAILPGTRMNMTSGAHLEKSSSALSIRLHNASLLPIVQ